MQKVAHILALLVAWFIWQGIGGIGGLVVAVLAVGVIEIVFMVILGAVSAPFRSGQSDASTQNNTQTTTPEGSTPEKQ